MPTFLIAQRRGERVDVLRHGLLVVAARRLGGLPEAAQVRRDHGVGLRQLRHQRPPHVAGLRVAVQQDHRLALAGGEIVKPDAVDLGEAAFDRAAARASASSWISLTPRPAAFLPSAACAAASRAIGTRNGEHDT